MKLRALWLSGPCAACLLAACSDSDPGAETVRQSIPKIELRITMPAGAEPVHAYQRYYAHTVVDGTPVIVGVYVARALLPEDQRPAESIQIVPPEQLPRAAGSGCGVIHVRFDPVQADKVEAICGSER